MLGLVASAYAAWQARTARRAVREAVARLEAVDVQGLITAVGGDLVLLRKAVEAGTTSEESRLRFAHVRKTLIEIAFRGDLTAEQKQVVEVLGGLARADA